MATSISVTFIATVLLLILRRRLRGIGGQELLKNTGKILLATLFISSFLLFGHSFAQEWKGYIGVVGVAALLYGFLLFFLRPRSGERVIDFVAQLTRTVLGGR